MTEEERLAVVRGRIDAIDGELLRLFNERAALAIEVGRIKREGNPDPDLYRPEREAQVLRRVRDTNPGPLPEAEAMRLVREVMSACLALEHPLKAAYLGPAGTFTHSAALKHFGGSVALDPAPTIEEVVRAVASGVCTYGVVPVENSLEGPINQTLDCLSDTALKVCGEIVLNVHHQLLTHCPTLTAIKRVYAHAQALAQCRHWLDANLPGVERVALSSNAEAARRVTTETDAAAIAGVNAAVLYGLPALKSNIEDRPDNTTRFLVLGQRPPGPSGEDLTSIVFSMPNRPGALYEILQGFADAGISMTRIESRPMRKGTWEYLFFVDIEGHADDPVVASALERVADRAAWLRVLGSYPRAVA
ncbi:MAG: prephenate dehydratase [Gammaproteobacteria bacterium]|nr:prephenate dehydratase [Gammaproteobacteria bacterium]MBI5614814.1 prephenate dehydratase [Gammaproteobacteria bacterium]